MTIPALVLGIAGEAAVALPHARLAAQLDPEALICHWVRGQVALGGRARRSDRRIQSRV